MQQSIPVEHAHHDLDLVAGHAAGDLSDTELARAEALLGACTSCADLRNDLVAIAAAVHSLPTPATTTRDYRLTPPQATSLRRGRWLKSLLRPFAAPRSTVRPVAMAFTSLGLVGLLVTGILPSLVGSGGALSPAPPAGAERALAGATAAAAPFASGAAGLPVPVVPSATENDSMFGSLGRPSPVADAGGSKSSGSTTPPVAIGAGQPQGSGRDETMDLQRLAAAERARIAEESNPIVAGSLVLLALGLALFALRFVARRVR